MHLTRRSFLKSTAAPASLGALSSITAVRRASAAEPLAFSRYAICNETFGDWPQEKIFQFAAECGYQGVEIAPFTIDHDVRKVTAKRRAELRKQAEKAGVQLVGLHWLLAKTEGLHLTSPDADTRRRTADYLGELARFCHDLGGKVMIFGSPQQRNLVEGVSPVRGMEYAAEVLGRAMPTMERYGVTLALEPLAPNETNFLFRSAQAVQLARRVDSPHCKMMLDCKAMITEPTPIPELIREHRDWMVHFHANDPNLRGPGMGDLDFVPIFEALRDVKFSGWISVEVFDYTPGPERLARESIEYMKKVAAEVTG